MADVLPPPAATNGEVFSEKAHKNVVTQEEFLRPDFDPKEMKQVASEAILLAGGAYAVLLQMAYPGVAKGVIYGTPEEKKTIIDWVHKAHSVVKGPDYTADDPDLQLWVASTLYAAATEIYQMFFGKLDEAFLNKLYREYSIIATSLRVPAHMWPKDRAAFTEYWNHMLETLEINQNAKNVCNDVCYNKHSPLWIRANLPFVRVLTAEWLTPRLRQEFGLNRSPKTYKFLMFGARAVYPALPQFVRHYPVRFYLKDMRKRMKKHKGTKWQ